MRPDGFCVSDLTESPQCQSSQLCPVPDCTKPINSAQITSALLRPVPNSAGPAWCSGSGNEGLQYFTKTCRPLRRGVLDRPQTAQKKLSAPPA